MDEILFFPGSDPANSLKLKEIYFRIWHFPALKPSFLRAKSDP
jgi:hypothetical protein